MKLSECIQEVKTEKPNSYSDDYLTKFINELEAMVQDYLGGYEIMSYKWEDDGSKDLIVKAPHDVIYKSWLKAKIDYANEEYESYSNNQAQFNSDYEEWKAYAMRNGMIMKATPCKIRNWW